MTNRPLGKIDTIVFDLDGTLVDSTADVTAALNLVLTAEGLRPLAPEAVVDLLGEGSTSLVTSAIVEAGGEVPSADEIERLTRDYLDHYAKTPVRDSRLFPQVAETLAALAQAGIRLGVCTNKNEALARVVLDHLGVGEYFTALVGGDRLPVRKPHPDHLLTTLSELGSTPETSAMVGDSVYDSGCAVAAGARAFAVAWAPPEVEGHRLRDFSELLEHIHTDPESECTR